MSNSFKSLINNTYSESASSHAYDKPIHVYSDYSKYKRYLSCGIVPVFIMEGTYYILGQVSRNLHQSTSCFGIPRLGVFKGRKRLHDKTIKHTACRELFEETAYTIKINQHQLINEYKYYSKEHTIWYVFINIPHTDKAFFVDWWMRYIHNQKRYIDDKCVYEIDTVAFVPLHNCDELWNTTRLLKSVIFQIKKRIVSSSSQLKTYDFVGQGTIYVISNLKNTEVQANKKHIPFKHRYDITYFNTVLSNFTDLPEFCSRLQSKLSTSCCACTRN